jgi:membrane-bound lytic murein transglycosylase F
MLAFDLIRFRWTVGICLALAASSCEKSDFVNQLFSGDAKNQQKVTNEDIFALAPEIVIATRNAPTSYFINREGNPAGYEYELASNFAKSLGKRPEFEVFDNIDGILEALENEEVQFAAAGLSKIPGRAKVFPFGPVYQTVQVYVVCHKSNYVRQLSDLIGKSVAMTGESSYEQIFADYQDEYPALTWTAYPNVSTEEILSQVENEEFDCGVADSNIFDLNRHLFPSLRVSFSIDESDLAWPVAPSHEFLTQRMDEWFEQAHASGLVDRLYEKYYGTANYYDPYDLRVFKQRIESRLPKYKGIIQQAAEESGLPFSLLAAVAYQESHWNPKSRSPTGVRGFMMLTLPTARSLGVSNRLDAKQSMLGGAKYLKAMIDRFPEFIRKEDRVWMGLASYNVGYYHLQDARQLAIKVKKNPNVWQDLKTVLPLLANKRYYRKLQYGYARGQEPVVYVRNIRKYRQVLNAELSPDTQQTAISH